MPRAQNCTFCGNAIPPGTGSKFVRNDGTVLSFCSSKCRHSTLNLRRDARKIRWTKYYGREERGRV